MKKKLLIIPYIIFSIAVVFTVIAFLRNLIISDKLTVIELIKDMTIWSVTAVIVVIAILFLLFNDKLRLTKRVLKLNKVEESHWLTMREMKRNKNLKVTSLNNLKSESDGVPIMAKIQKGNNDADVVLAKPIHTLIVGTTGSGKTSGFVDPTIQILSRCKTKPSLVITDPKGELYIRHSDSLRTQGYNVQLIDLVDVYHSQKWNPFNGILLKTNRMQNAKIEQKNGKYYFCDKEYLSFEQAEKELEIEKQILNDEIYSDLLDLIYAACPLDGNAQSPMWQRGARDLILALALAFWEDIRDGLMRSEQLCLYNLYKNISLYCNNECEEFKAYFNKRDKFSKTLGLANTVLVTQDRTLTSYLGDVIQYFNWMADSGLASLTSGNEVVLDKFDEEPTALFLRIPDHKENRYKIAKLLITQMYKALVDKADNNIQYGKTKESELLRNVYFIMDEFVNMPKFDNIVQMLRVGRSRKIFMLPIIQDFAGLDVLYSKETAMSIKTNCNIKVFIGTTDLNTAKEFSESCGNHRIKNISFSNSKDLSVNTSAQDHPLIHFDELMRLNDPPQRMGNAITLAFGKYPLKSLYTPLFKAKKLYGITESEIEKREAELFNEEAVFYDITLRNQFLDENDKLMQQQEEEFLQTISKLSKTELEEQPIDPLSSLKDKLKEKINALAGKLPDDKIQQLIATPLDKLTDILDKLIDEAQTAGNNFLVFELVQIKVFAKEILKLIDKEINKEQVNL